MTNHTTNDLTLTVPSYDDLVDIPLAFENFTDGMPAGTSVVGSATSVTSADINKIFNFNNTSATRVEHTLTLTGSDFWKTVDGRDYGFQFGVSTANDFVAITADAGSSILPFPSVKENSFAIVTRVSPTLWVIVGGGADTSIFQLDVSLLGSGDYFA